MARDAEPFKPGDTVTVAGHGGIAFRVQGFEQVWEPARYLASDDDGNEWWEEDSSEGEWIDSLDGRYVAIMVGDDHPWTFDAEDMTPIPDTDYCGECGQVGCGWGAAPADDHNDGTND